VQTRCDLPHEPVVTNRNVLSTASRSHRIHMKNKFRQNWKFSELVSVKSLECICLAYCHETKSSLKRNSHRQNRRIARPPPGRPRAITCG